MDERFLDGAAQSNHPRRLVLVVDDEAMLRKSTARLLELLGYRVVVAEDGHEAVARFREHRQDLDVVLLDLHMPGMGGAGAFAAMHAIDDRVPIILCSGDITTENVSQLLAQGAAGFLAKPYPIARLLALLRQFTVNQI